MTDIVDRLRIHADAIEDGTPVPYGRMGEVQRRAADEIESLRADRELLVALVQHITAHDPHWAVAEWVQDEDVSVAEHDRICAVLNGAENGI